MASIVEKYEQILAADPRSRIFVELAKVLVDRGECTRAIEVCRRGLDHHPSSILGRVTWGRALLSAGDVKGALDQFEIAIALEPASPYAYNHVGEALLRKGLHREALPVLARAAELQPADARVRTWLDEATRRVRGEPDPAPAAPSSPRLSLEDESAEESTEPYRPLSWGRATPRNGSNGTETTAPAFGVPAAADGDATPTSIPTPTATATATPNSTPTATATQTSTPASAPTPVAASDGAAAPPPLPRPGGETRREGTGRSVLYMIPEDAGREVIGPSLASRLDIPVAREPSHAPVAHADPAAAERAAAQYERELREKLLSVPEPPPPLLHRRQVVAGIALGVALLAAGGVYLFVSHRTALLAAEGAAGRARAGLARDTLASLREAHRLLSDARDRSTDPEVGSLAAQVAAVLAVEHGDGEAREVARALVASGQAGDGALAARWLLAAPGAERAAADAAILAARPSATPLVQALAGRILVGRGEVAGGRGRLELAAQAKPPLLRALSDLGDLSLAAGDPQRALAYYGAALAAHPTHPRSVVGAAEARLAAGEDLESSRRELDAVDGDAGSAPPEDLRLRFELARARVHAALGDPAGAAARLARAAEKLGEDAPLAATVAELHLQARAWDKAESAASRAVAREPDAPDHRVLLARARIGRGRLFEALAATDGVDGRAVRLQRAIARYRLGQWSEARAELQGTARDGKIPAEAAVWYALVDLATGRPDRARSLLERLAQAKSPPPLAHVALGRALEALGRRAEAEKAYRAAVEREPLAPEGHLALGRTLLESGRAEEALAPLERAVKLDPSDLAARRSLGEARLRLGQPSAARADLDFVLLASPRDADALRLLSAAWLSEGQASEARLAADRAIAVAPGDPGALVAGAHAAMEAGDAAAARRLAARALKAGATGAERDEARRLASGQLPRKR